MVILIIGSVTNVVLHGSFRGDNVNGFDPDDRQPDPERLLQYDILHCFLSLVTFHSNYLALLPL